MYIIYASVSICKYSRLALNRTLKILKCYNLVTNVGQIQVNSAAKAVCSTVDLYEAAIYFKNHDIFVRLRESTVHVFQNVAYTSIIFSPIDFLTVAIAHTIKQLIGGSVQNYNPERVLC